MNYAIDNALMVNEGKITSHSVYIVDGKISFTRPESDACEHIDATGCYLLPGVIDTHVHFRDAGDGASPNADFHTESRAAALGGVTSVIDMPNTVPPTTSLHLLEAKERRAAETSFVNYGFMLAATHDNIDELLTIEPSRYAAIKVFLGSSTGNLLLTEADLLDKLFSQARKLIVAHCEDEDTIRANMALFKQENQGTEREQSSLHPQIRTSAACYLATYRAIERARKYNTRLHIAHISTATELNLLSNLPLNEKKITAEVTPNHLWFDDSDYQELNNLIKCNPAIKSKDDRLALWAALYDGLIDTIGSDHAPHSLESKLKPYFDAPSGMPSVQHTLLMMVELLFNPTTPEAEKQQLTETWLPLIVEKMCHNPAVLFGIKARGFIREGYHADIVLLKLTENNVVTTNNIAYKCKWSPLLGKNFHAKVDKTFVNGALVYDGNSLSDNIASQKLEFEK